MRTPPETEPPISAGTMNARSRRSRVRLRPVRGVPVRTVSVAVAAVVKIPGRPALARGGADLHLVARGANLDAIQRDGIRVLAPRGDFTARPPATDDPRGSGRRREPSDLSRASDRMRGVRRHRARGPRRRPPSGGNALHDRRAERHPVGALPAFQPGHDRWRAEMPHRDDRASERSVGQADGQRFVQSAERVESRDDRGHLPV